MMYYEDLEVGMTSSSGAYEVTAEEVRDFASKYDPQPFHLSQEAAAKTHFGRISASGWHTCAMTMRMLVDSMNEVPRAGMGSPGIDELRWKHPVYPGDTLRIETELLEKRRSRSKPELGLFKTCVRTFNQDGVMVMEMTSNGMIGVREPGAKDD
ncbi:hypothetical protein GCM10010923_10210 [Blastomonas marina]|uniref:MaoC-like domain-containing protein n=1 Tax=Blastomonas marina TaxID=1867408 RepID=A0ABQ1FA10_9SPHN|nr:MaoC family dehydratase [Blastomonas marina]GGA03310.1 hypothetical protein GCM10010923_10210 [Blastomonas marina]